MNPQIIGKKLILIHADFDSQKRPRLKLGDVQTGQIFTFTPKFDTNITLKINLNERFCRGWHDLKTGKDFLCPDNLTIDKKYQQCHNCQKKTGFDPAFYNSSQGKISTQQAERNSQPHFVYLAYFSDAIIKVGISFCGRKNARLLEQGARAALILGEFSTANIARNYEEKISKMPNFCENVKISMKLKSLEKEFNFEKAKRQLLIARQKIEDQLNIKFEQNQPLNLDKFYNLNENCLEKEIISIEDCQNPSENLIFSGKLIAQVGCIMLAETAQNSELLAISLKKVVGRKIELSEELIEIHLPKRQTSLFSFSP